MKTECKSLADVLRLLASPECVSITRWDNDTIERSRLVKNDRLSFMVEFELLLRVCVDVDFCPKSTIISVQEMTGYNDKKHAWTVEGRRYRASTESKRGQKAVLNWLDEFFDRTSGRLPIGHRRNFTTSLRDGKLSAY